MKLLLLNPKRKSTVKKGAAMHKRKSAHKVKRAHHKRRNPRAVATVSASPVRHHRRRHNPSPVAIVAARRKRRFGSGSRGIVPAAKQTIMQGAIAGLGAVGADLAAGQIMKYLPDSLKTAQVQPFAQVFVSLLAGFVISKVNKKAGDAVAFGGVTVATYNLSKSLLIKAGIPGLSGFSNLQGYDYNPNYGIGVYDPGLRSVSSPNPLAEYPRSMFTRSSRSGMGMYDTGQGTY